jgi:hypothetical protein
MMDASSNALASMQAPPTPAVPDDRATEFTAVEGGEHYSGSTLLVEAYAAIWLILMVWIFMLWRKGASLADRLDGLERAIDRAAAATEKKANAKAS